MGRNDWPGQIEGPGHGDPRWRRRLFLACLLSLVCHALAATSLGYFYTGTLPVTASGVVPKLSIMLVDKADRPPKIEQAADERIEILASASSSSAGERSVPNHESRSNDTVRRVENEQTVAAETEQSSPYYYPPEWLTQRPVPLSSITPRYPEGIEGIAGRVRLLLLIDESGVVNNFHVLQSEPPGLFEEESIIAFTQAKYGAGRLGTLSVKSQFIVDIEFSADAEPAFEN